MESREFRMSGTSGRRTLSVKSLESSEYGVERGQFDSEDLTSDVLANDATMMKKNCLLRNRVAGAKPLPLWSAMPCLGITTPLPRHYWLRLDGWLN